MCKCNNTNCGCETYSGKCVLYTGVNVNSPFEFKTNSSFNEFVIKVTDYLAGLTPTTRTLTIETIPVNAIVKINGVITNTITAPIGTEVTVEATLSGYETILSTFFIGLQNETVTLTMVPLVTDVTVTFNSNPMGAIITINGIQTNTFTGPIGTLISVEATLSGYLPYTQNYTLVSTTTVTLNLTDIQNVTINFVTDPSGGVISINGVITNSFTGLPGTVVNIEASLAGYIAYNESYTIPNSNGTHTLNLQSIAQYTVQIVPTPSNAIISINGVFTDTFTGSSGTVLNILVTSEPDYEAASFQYTIGTSNEVIPIGLELKQFTLTFVSSPPGALITVNGITTNTFTGSLGDSCIVVASLTGFITNTVQYFVQGNELITIYLQEDVPVHTFKYYWGEIGNIFAANPSLISQTNWDNQIKPDGTGGNMNEITAQQLLSSYNKDSTNNPLQWWIMLIPTDETAAINALPNYVWYTWDNINSTWTTFTEHTPYTGAVTLDGIDYTYSAIRPNVADRIRFAL